MKSTQPWYPSITRRMANLQSLFTPSMPIRSSPLDGIDFVTNRALTKEAMLLCQMCNVFPTPMKKGTFYRRQINFGSVQIQMAPRNSSRSRHKIHINPSKAGMSLQDVLDWIVFLVGSLDDVYVTNCDYKLDLLNMSGRQCLEMIWSPRHKESSMPYPSSLYLGKSDYRQTVVYDKGLKLGVGCFARVEMRIPFESRTMTAQNFFDTLTTTNPFVGVCLVDEDLKKIAKDQNVPQNLLAFKVLKNIPNGRRDTLLRHLEQQGKLIRLEDTYATEITAWVSGHPLITIRRLPGSYSKKIKALKLHNGTKYSPRRSSSEQKRA